MNQREGSKREIPPADYIRNTSDSATVFCCTKLNFPSLKIKKTKHLF